MPLRYIRTVYEALREEERIKLNEYLRANEEIRNAGLYVVSGGLAGKGSYRYKYHKDSLPFDLRNWKWVEVKSKDGFDCVISLNMLEIDHRTKNIHSLYDRIGLILSPDQKDWVHTSIDLPLDDADREEIVNSIIEQYEKFQKGKGANKR